MTHEELTLAMRLAVNDALVPGETLFLSDEDAGDASALAVRYVCDSPINLSATADRLAGLLNAPVCVELHPDGTVRLTGRVEERGFRIAFVRAGQPTAE